ncbi:MAG: Smr/MutS family protein [Rikenellaceae bacterium]|nr:Smr/MutS family protein [Rikenellaceae bacterium]
MEIGSKLGFDRIREQVEALCTTQGARDIFAGEGFSCDRAEVEYRLGVCSEMSYALTMESGFPTGEYYDINPVVDKARIEGTFLETEELALLKAALTLISGIRDFFVGRGESSYPLLRPLAVAVEPYGWIAARIDRIIDRHGNIKDDASPELAEIRRDMRAREGQVSKRLRSILAQARSAGIVDGEASVSIREGRAVIPVTASNKRKLPGIVHDESSTGKTVYIEPAEIVELNNEMRELEYSQRREIVRLLTEFTDSIRPELDGISASGLFLVSMDLIRAKARFASANGCVAPLISDDGVLELRSARHPLLEQNLKKEGRRIVPLDMVLTRRKRILIISGPNAGGKSVCLKTVGLLQIMLQHGLPVPVLENSQFPLFESIFVDIGDEQSIDNDLSTYSSHLLNMKRMVQGAGEKSLILIDEFGTGTEPVIGGAIAEALLEDFEKKGCYGVITTHYSNLKYYASNAEGVVNGAMTFDVQNIRPLFKLEMGMPGSSFAIEIARKTGLPEAIIKKAAENAGSDRVNLERLLREVARDRRYWEQKRERIRVADRKVGELEQKYALQLEDIRRQRTQIIREAKDRAAKITDEANRIIESAVRDIRESQADKDTTILVRRNIEQFRENLTDEDSGSETSRIDREMEKIERRRQKREQRRGEKKSESSGREQEILPSVPVVGSKVKMDGQLVAGEVMEIKGKRATVAFGQITTRVALDKLTVVSNSEFRKQHKPTAPTVKVSTDVEKRKLNFSQNIDLRGMRAAEALERVEDFIDDAIMVGASQVRILHGKGTGALKEEIRRYLRTVDLVISAADEHVEQGGAGITVVKLDV